MGGVGNDRRYHVVKLSDICWSEVAPMECIEEVSLGEPYGALLRIGLPDPLEKFCKEGKKCIDSESE